MDSGVLRFKENVLREGNVREAWSLWRSYVRVKPVVVVLKIFEELIIEKFIFTLWIRI